MVLALTAGKSTLGLVFVFFIFFPVLVNVLIGLMAGQIAGERSDNERFREGLDES